MDIQIPEFVSVIVATLLAVAEFRRFRRTTYPTLAPPPPVAPSIDLAPLTQRLESAVTELEQLRKEQKRQRWNDFILALVLLTVVVMEVLPS